MQSEPASTAETSPRSAPLQWPAASATPFRISTDSSFKGVKIHLLDSQPELEMNYSTQKMIQRTLAGGTQRIPHPWLMTDWKMINIFAVLLPQKISKDHVSAILTRWKENGTEFPTSEAVGFMPAERMASPSRDTGSWPDSCGRTMV